MPLVYFPTGPTSDRSKEGWLLPQAADLSWNSSRLEGNTYSLLETERLISAGKATTGKDALETQMILNHKEAIEFLISAADDIRFNRYTLLNLHALLSDNLLPDPTASGRVRAMAVSAALRRRQQARFAPCCQHPPD